MATTDTSGRFLFLGNALCMDFVNTERMRDGERVDLLETVDDLWTWLAESGALTTESAKSAARFVAAGRALREAKALRAALRRMAEQMAGGDTVGSDVSVAVNEHLGRRIGRTLLAPGAGGWGLEFQAGDARGLDFLYAVALSAAELIANGDPGLVRQCESARCILYFYDTTKNHGRRWCSMDGCGNRHKASEHYRRRREKSASNETLD